MARRQANKVKVPDVQGDQEATAQAAILGAGLQEQSIPQISNQPVGKVLYQAPAGNSFTAPGATVYLAVSTGPQPVAVPDVTGEGEATAHANLSGAGFSVQPIQVTDTTHPAGTVVSQSPAGGTDAPLGSGVTINIAEGPNAVKVPDVTGSQLSSAQAQLQGAGFALQVLQQTSNQPVGQVLTESPAGNTFAAPGSTVYLAVSSGPQAVTVPDVIGEDQTTAISNLHGAGFTVNPVPVVDTTDPAGQVISQTPTGNTSAPFGSSVSVQIATGPTPVKIPDVTGSQLSSAQAQLQGAGFALQVLQQTSNQPVGQVLTESPAGNTFAAPGSTVYLAVSSGPQSVTVPDVVGQDQNIAVANIQAVGLSAFKVPTASSTVAAGQVISQAPSGGIAVAVGSTVTLLVSSGASNLKVPDVTNLPQDQAQNALVAAGFKLSNIVFGYQTDSSNPGTVIAQDPAANSFAAPDAVITLTLSSGPITVTVPDLTNMDQNIAQQRATDAGLAPTIQYQSSSGVAAGIVVDQSPAPGTVVGLLHPLTLFVSTGPAPITVPSVVGLMQNQAQNAFTVAGFNAANIVFAYQTNDAPAGTVLTQNPTAGSGAPQRADHADAVERPDHRYRTERDRPGSERRQPASYRCRPDGAATGVPCQQQRACRAGLSAVAAGQYTGRSITPGHDFCVHGSGTHNGARCRQSTPGPGTKGAGGSGLQHQQYRLWLPEQCCHCGHGAESKPGGEHTSAAQRNPHTDALQRTRTVSVPDLTGLGSERRQPASARHGARFPPHGIHGQHNVPAGQVFEQSPLKNTQVGQSHGGIAVHLDWGRRR